MRFWATAQPCPKRGWLPPPKLSSCVQALRLTGESLSVVSIEKHFMGVLSFSMISSRKAQLKEVNTKAESFQEMCHIYWLKIQVCGAVVMYELTYPILRAWKLVFNPLLNGHIIFSISLKTLWTSSWYFSSRICSSVKFLNMAFRIGISSGSEFVSIETEDSVVLRST